MDTYYAFLIQTVPHVQYGSKVFFPRVLYGSRDAVENFNRDLLQHRGNSAGLSQLVLNANISMYGFERFEQSCFDKVFRLVYLVLAFALDCCYRLCLQLPGVVSILDLGPYTSLPCICSPVLSSEGSIVSTLDGKLPPT